MTMTHEHLRTSSASRIAAGGASGGRSVMIVGPAGSASRTRWASTCTPRTGSTTLPGPGQSACRCWGYSARRTPCAVSRPGGPTLPVVAGDDGDDHPAQPARPRRPSVLVGGQPMVPDTDGVSRRAAPRRTRSPPTVPGPTSTRPAPMPGAQHQIAMGLYGALVVEPATAGQAYDAATTRTTTDHVLVLGEIDPRAEQRRQPGRRSTCAPSRRSGSWSTAMRTPTPPRSPRPPGQTVLLRWVNAGMGYHSMGVLGADQRVVALDGSQLRTAATTPRRYVAETFGPGQTADAIVTVPATAADRRLAVYDASLTLHNTQRRRRRAACSPSSRSPAPAAGTDASGPATRGVAWSGGALSGHGRRDARSRRRHHQRRRVLRRHRRRARRRHRDGGRGRRVRLRHGGGATHRCHGIGPGDHARHGTARALRARASGTATGARSARCSSWAPTPSARRPPGSR